MKESEMPRVTFKSSPKGEMAILPRGDYEALVARLNEKIEDAGTMRLVAGGLAALAEGREVLLPLAVSRRIAAGENAVKVLREFRQKSQAELALQVGIGQSYLSTIESGARKGPMELHAKIARALGVPLELLIGIAVASAEADPKRTARRKKAVAIMRKTRRK
jgi:DNA-binding XRE family transcriptional regulator